MISVVSRAMARLDTHPSASGLFMLAYAGVTVFVAPVALKTWRELFMWLYGNPIKAAIYRWRERRWLARQPKPEKSPYR